MSNTNRDYLIVCEVKNSKITVARQLNFYITDKNTSNIFIKLVNRIENDNGVSSYADIENATAYKVTLRIVKPNNETISVMATQLEPEAIYQVDLEENCKNIAGTYKCELLITTTVNGREELNTSDPFTYLVKKSILSDVGEIVETGGITTEQLINKIDTVKAELSSQIKEIENIGNPTDEQVSNAINQAIADGKITSGNGWSTNAITLFETLISKLAFTDIVTGKSLATSLINELKSPTSSGGSSGGGSTEPDIPVEVVEFPVPCNGVDVSRWQGDMNFTAVKESGGVKFVIMRIGYGSRTGGTPVIDPKFEIYLKFL